MMKREEYNLPWPTSQTITGPKLCLDSLKLIVDYDFEDDDGSAKWTQITFRDVLSFEYRQVACCCAEDLDAYNQIVRYLDSDWLKAMMHRWRRFLGDHASESQEMSYAHWRMYFDDAGCVDIIARSFEIG